MQTFGLNEIVVEIEIAIKELNKAQEFVTDVFMQDFSYTGVQKAFNALRGAQYELSLAKRCAGFAAETIHDAVYGIRNA